MKGLCFVDGNLNVVDDVDNAVGVANVRLDRWVEILFFAPIAKNVTFNEAKKACYLWRKEFYPKYMNCMPSLETCDFVNGYLPEDKKFRNCYVFKPIDYEYTHIPRTLYQMDRNGVCSLSGLGDRMVENAYAAIFMHLITFRKLNRFVNIAHSYRVSLYKDKTF